MEPEHVHGPDCNHDNDDNTEDFSTEELVFAANDKVDILVDLLVKKGLITEDEYEQELNRYYKELEAEENNDSNNSENNNQSDSSQE
ncbi:hypothetical protein HOK68_02020 [Candidatus Woesearchaeota archaeon]|jgi:hypothetical protein|nr:hypothetical protein [Candidatus Woesearchaeota archaeon]MBT4387768.1 hypothetical protein [Candidatus Woesearchaeota archaeon]MBT4595587.1 hypothetical protein [Candidatus Woesearchaeota archaeon]MBT5740930.1 hypothetical protein [Candidatus Woesearchaeota archaeon]MBT6505532.1 hypothetical protein [Candidatus Woesearchaeota archaeon]